MELANPGIKMMIADAKDYVKSCEPSDFVVVDLYEGRKIPDFVFDEEFIFDLRQCTKKLLAVNCTFYKWGYFDVYNKAFIVDVVKQVNEDKVLFFNPRMDKP